MISKPQYKPRYKPERLSERKAVTIAVGLVCHHGIIIGADGEITHGFVKSQRVKMFECCPVEGIKIIGAGAGDEMLLDNVKEKIKETLDTSVPDLVSLKRGIEKIILDTLKDIWPLYDPKDRPELELLLAIKAIDSLGLFQVNGAIVRDVPKFSCIGFGTDLAMYKAKYLMLSPLPIAISVTIMAHLIHIVKENVRYCGGQSSIWVLHEDGEKEEKDATFIRDAEQVYRLFELAMSAFAYILPTYSGPANDEIQNFAEWFLEKAKEMPESDEEARIAIIGAILEEATTDRAKKYAYLSKFEDKKNLEEQKNNSEQ